LHQGLHQIPLAAQATVLPRSVDPTAAALAALLTTLTAEQRAALASVLMVADQPSR